MGDAPVEHRRRSHRRRGADVLRGRGGSCVLHPVRPYIGSSPTGRPGTVPFGRSMATMDPRRDAVRRVLATPEEAGMTTFEVVTTFAPRHWESHARRCVESFHKHWEGI